MPDWIWCLTCLGFLVALIYHGHLSRKHGIWDGAFNQFLPDVKAAMHEYDPVRAEEIFAERRRKYGLEDDCA